MEEKTAHPGLEFEQVNPADEPQGPDDQHRATSMLSQERQQIGERVERRGQVNHRRGDQCHAT